MDIDADLAHLAARARRDADLCRAVAARVEGLDSIRWRSFASARFREQTARRAHHLRFLAGECELLAKWLDHLVAVLRRSEEAT